MHTGSAWRRLAAFGFDYLVIAGYIVVLTILSVATSSLISPQQLKHASPWLYDLLAFVTLVLPVVLYFAGSEASRHQATWGKRRLGLIVIAPDGNRLGVGGSLLRSTLKFLPWQIAHTSLFHIPGWPGAVNSIPATAATGLWLSSILAAAYVASLFVVRDRRTPYDRLAGTRVVMRNDR